MEVVTISDLYLFKMLAVIVAIDMGLVLFVLQSAPPAVHAISMGGEFGYPENKFDIFQKTRVYSLNMYVLFNSCI